MGKAKDEAKTAEKQTSTIIEVIAAHSYEIDTFIESLADGDSLRQAAKKANIPLTTLLRWTVADVELAERYARAREVGYDLMADGLIDIADEAAPLDSANTKNKIDARKWLLSKRKPKVYGDKLALGGDSDNPLQTVVEIRRVIVDGRKNSSN